MAARLHFAGVLVVIQLVGLNLLVGGLENHVAAQVTDRSFRFLGDRIHVHLIARGHVRTLWFYALIWIGCVHSSRLLHRRRRRNKYRWWDLCYGNCGH